MSSSGAQNYLVDSGCSAAGFYKGSGVMRSYFKRRLPYKDKRLEARKLLVHLLNKYLLKTY